MKQELLDKYFEPKTLKTKKKSILSLIRSRKYRITDERVMAYDSPTGKAYVGVAKRPLANVKNGYGFKGVLMQTDNRQFIQCHICGKWLRQLTKGHLETHKITKEKYRKKFGLLNTTALVADSLSYSLEDRGRKNILRFNLQTEKAAKAREKATKSINRKAIKYNDEYNNRYGLCEKQLGFRLVEYLKRYKILPSRSQKGEGRLISKALYHRYGSVNNGFKHYGLPVLYRQGTNVELVAQDGKQHFFNYNKLYTREDVYNWMVDHSPVLQGNINQFADDIIKKAA